VKYYAGIGSRETPYHICKMMTDIAKRLSSLDYVCRSGGADGADDGPVLGASGLDDTGSIVGATEEETLGAAVLGAKPVGFKHSPEF
jgi:hypothetical protein